MLRSGDSTSREVNVAETLKKGTRVTGADRSKLAADLKSRYDAGESIRSLAASTGRSYGFVHRMLSENGVKLRRRGSATRCKPGSQPCPVGSLRDTPGEETDMAPSPGAPEGAGLKLDVNGAVATVTLQRPERRNAMTPPLWHGLAAIGDALPPQVRVGVGRGDRPSFSAG